MQNEFLIFAINGGTSEESDPQPIYNPRVKSFPHPYKVGLQIEILNQSMQVLRMDS